MQWINKHRVFSIVLLVVLILAGVLAYSDLYQLWLPLPAEREPAFTRAMEVAKVPGSAMAFIRDGQITIAEGYGLADVETGREVTPDTLFTIASVSKTVTATALMTLYEQGKFSLDDDINDYLPFSIHNPNYPEHRITFRMLLTHTSSIKDSDIYEEYYTLQNKPVLPDSPVQMGDYLKDYLTPGGSLYNAAENFSGNEPGTTYLYSNTAFGLVGYLVEQISGLPFADYCRESVFSPLGMVQSEWLFRDVDTGKMAIPYGYNDILRRPMAFGFYGYPTYPDGALKTSVLEYARFISIFVNDGSTLDGIPFLKPETVDEMLALQTFPDLEPESIGLAWHNKNGVYYHTGGDPGISTIVEFNTETKRAAVLFTNGSDMGLPGLLRESYFLKNSSRMLKALMKAP